MKKVLSVLVLVLGFTGLLSAESLINAEGKDYKFTLSAESGFVTVISHEIQFGLDGTKFDYKKEGNQDVLFPFNRYEAQLRLFDNHGFFFLYQPLEVATKAKASRDISVYDVDFPQETALDLIYSFSFYRVSYVWYFLKDKANELGIGLSMQVRNATIVFEAADGSEIEVNQNVGPVPILKINGKYAFDNGFWTALDADGFYASSSFFNGSEFPFEGYIWDVSARAGLELKNGINPFINVRFLGGGGKGTSKSKDARGDGYTDNRLSTMSVTLGVELR